MKISDFEALSLQDALNELGGATLPDEALIGTEEGELDNFDKYAEALEESTRIDGAILTLESIREDLDTMVDNGEVTEEGLTDIETQIYAAIDEKDVEPATLDRLSTQSYITHMGTLGASQAMMHDLDGILTTMAIKSNSLKERIKGGFQDFVTNGADLMVNLVERAKQARTEVQALSDWDTSGSVKVKDLNAISLNGKVDIAGVCNNLADIGENQIKDAKFQKKYIASIPKAVDYVLKRHDDEELNENNFAKAIDLNPGKPFEKSTSKLFQSAGGFDVSNKNVEAVSMHYWEAKINDGASFFINTPTGKGTYTIDARAISKRRPIKGEVRPLSKSEALKALDAIINLGDHCPDKQEAARIVTYVKGEVQKIMNDSGGYSSLSKRLGGVIDEDSREQIEKAMGGGATGNVVGITIGFALMVGFSAFIGGFVIGGNVGRIIRQMALKSGRDMENVLTNSLLGAMVSFYKQVKRVLGAVVQYVSVSSK